MSASVSTPGHESPDQQPFIQIYIDPDNQEMVPKPPNERSIGLSGNPDRSLDSEVEI